MSLTHGPISGPWLVESAGVWDQNVAGEQVRNILKKDPEAFQDRILKCSFGEGGRQWAGDIYTPNSRLGGMDMRD